MVLELMKLEDLIECEIIRRLNRFVVEVSVHGSRKYAHINNTGRLLEYVRGGRRGLLRHIKGRKTAYRLSMILEDDGSASIIDTGLQMRCFESALQMDLISWIKGAEILRRNIRLGSSVIDYLMAHLGRKILVELKSAVMRVGNFASYPDCPTERGRRQVRELLKHPKDSILVFIAGMKGVKAFTPCRSTDPVLYGLIRDAQERGVLVKAIQIYYDLKRGSVILENDDLKVVIE